MAVADIFHALILRRVYKPACSPEEAIAVMKAGRGRHFDPDMLDAFLQIEQEVRAIARRYRVEGQVG